MDKLKSKKTDFLQEQTFIKLITDAKATRKVSAISTFQPGNNSVVLEQWNYIRYKDGSKELCDRPVYKSEFKNITMFPAYDPR